MHVLARFRRQLQTEWLVTLGGRVQHQIVPLLGQNLLPIGVRYALVPRDVAQLGKGGHLEVQPRSALVDGGRGRHNVVSFQGDWRAKGRRVVCLGPAFSPTVVK